MANTQDRLHGLIKIDNGWYAAPMHDPDGQRLARLHGYGVLDTPPEAAFDRISALAAALFATPIALINLIDTHRQWFKSCYGMANIRETPLDHAFCTHALHSREKVMVINDASQDERFYNNPLVTGWPYVRFYAGASMINRDGYKIGSLCVIDRVPRDGLGDHQQDHLASLATIAMDQIELSLTNRKAGQQIERLRSYGLRSRDRPQPARDDQAQALSRSGAASLLVAGADHNLIELLRACGCDYEDCATPHEVLDIMAARGGSFDAVILGQSNDKDEDGVMNACHAARELRTMHDRHYRKLPVIGLTPPLSSEFFELYMQAGMNDILQTPVSAQSLYNCLREYLGADMLHDMATEWACP